MEELKHGAASQPSPQSSVSSECSVVQLLLKFPAFCGAEVYVTDMTRVWICG